MKTQQKDSKPRNVASTFAAALAGIVAAIATLGIGDLLAYVIAPAGRPVTAVGEAAIKLMPPPIIDFAKSTFGTADKPILIGTIIGIVVIVAGLAGILERRRRGVGYTILALFVAAGILAASTRADSTATTWLPIFLGGAVGMVIFGYLLKKLARTDASMQSDAAAVSMTEKPAAKASRRGFFTLVGAAGVAAVAVNAAGYVVNAAGSKVAALRDALKLPAAAKPLAAIPASAQMNLPGQSTYITPADKFYRIDTSLSPPQIDPQNWTLKISGMVDKPFEISYADLMELELEEHVITLACVSNTVGGDLVGNAKWLGYPIRELLKRAGVQSGADMVLQTSHDGWTCGTPLTALTDQRDAILAVAMNGAPLPVEHGFPVRSVVPGLYGYVSATKWVTEFKVTTFAKDEGYWTPLGWDALGPIKVMSRIDTPSLTKPPKAGKVVIAGVAWHQGVGISKVEVKVNDGEWKTAELAEEFTIESWIQWRIETELAEGLTTAVVRATNKKGEVQIEKRSNPDPNGATGWHTAQFTVEA